MFKTIIFLVGFMLCGLDSGYAEEPPRAATQQQPAALAQKEQAASKPIPNIDPLAELGKLSEGDILIIEHCLAALYYYPNDLTGKPSQKLVEAIKEYQKDFAANRITGYITELFDFRDLIDRVRENFLFNVLLGDLGNIEILNNGNTVIASGLWKSGQEEENRSFHITELIVCKKEIGLCHSSVTVGSADTSSGKYSYSKRLFIYEIKEFTSKQIVAALEESYQSMGNRQDLSMDCYDRILTINSAENTATISVKMKPEKINRKSCYIKEYGYAKLYNLNSMMTKEAYLGRYSELERTINNRMSETKDIQHKLLKIIQALKALTKEDLKRQPEGLLGR